MRITNDFFQPEDNELQVFCMICYVPKTHVTMYVSSCSQIWALNWICGVCCVPLRIKAQHEYAFCTHKTTTKCFTFFALIHTVPHSLRYQVSNSSSAMSCWCSSKNTIFVRWIHSFRLLCEYTNFLTTNYLLLTFFPSIFHSLTHTLLTYIHTAIKTTNLSSSRYNQHFHRNMTILLCHSKH